MDDTCTTGGSVAVLLGNGDGTFQTALPYGSGGDQAQSVAVADVNGDGKLDVIVVCSGHATFSCSPGVVGVLLGNGDGTFQTAVIYYSVGAHANSVAVADVNGDGKPDLLVANLCPDWHCNPEVGPSSVAVLLGNGDGTFQAAVPYGSGGFPTYSIAVADVNGDGKPDLVVGSSCQAGCLFGASVGVLLGNGDGTFQTAVPFDSGAAPAGASPVSATVADVNGDGKPDLLAVNSGAEPNCTTGSVGVLINTSAIAALSPTSLSFGNQALGTTSAPQNVTLVNTGNWNTALSISSIGIAGPNGAEFAQTNTCGTSLPPGGSCPITVTFTPTAFGNANASLNVTDSAPGSPQTAALTSFGNGSGVSLSPSNVPFPSQYVGTSGLPQTVTLTNIGNATLTITNVTANPADFGALNACSSSVAPGASCSIGVFFDPTTTGTRTGTLTVTDNASDSPQQVPLSGTGQDFSVSPSGSSMATVTPGQTANYTVAVAPRGGFKQRVTLSCSGGPGGSTCAGSPVSVALNGSTSTSVTVTVTTAGTSASLAQPDGFPPAGSNRLALWLALSGFSGLVLLGSRGGWSGKRHGRLLYGLAFLCLFSLGIIGSACGGGGASSGSGTPAGTYNLTVTGTFTSGSTTLTHDTKLTLVVQ